jgi:hypothetical protein
MEELRAHGSDNVQRLIDRAPVTKFAGYDLLKEARGVPIRSDIRDAGVGEGEPLSNSATKIALFRASSSLPATTCSVGPTDTTRRSDACITQDGVVTLRMSVIAVA